MDKERPILFSVDGVSIKPDLMDDGKEVCDCRGIDFLREADSNFPLVNHDLSNCDPIDLISYASVHGFENEALAMIEGFGDFSIDFESLSTEELDIKLRERLSNPYVVIQKSLDDAYRFGFHKHGLEHADVVTDRTLLAIREYYSDKDVNPKFVERMGKLAVVSGRIHDLGCMFRRKDHQDVAIGIAKKILGKDFIEDEDWEVVERAVKYHEIGAAKKLIEDKYLTEDGKIDYGKLIEKEGPLIFALLRGDKTDIGRDRVSDIALVNYMEVVNGAMPDLFVKKDGLIRDEKVESDHQVIYFNREGIPDNTSFEEWFNLTFGEESLLAGDRKRFSMAAIATFVLHPEVQEYKIKVFDEKSRESREIVFERNESFEDLMNFRVRVKQSAYTVLESTL